jgi:hypothetical protein
VRARSAARASPRLLGIASSRLLAASVPTRHLLGTCLALAWYLLDICFGAPLLLWDPTSLLLSAGLACIPQLPLVLVRLLGEPSYWGTHSASAPPTGGIHSSSRTGCGVAGANAGPPWWAGVWLDWARSRFRFYQPSSFNTALQLVLRPHFLVHFV